jgi:hypothetical protein
MLENDSQLRHCCLVCNSKIQALQNSCCACSHIRVNYVFVIC